jgi:hypothetical protein
MIQDKFAAELELYFKVKNIPVFVGLLAYS